jgi:hypothetical protein
MQTLATADGLSAAGAAVLVMLLLVSVGLGLLFLSKWRR